MKSITIHTLIIITCLSLILAACQPLQKLAAEPVGGSISALPGSPASICNKSSGSVWVSLIDTSTNVSSFNIINSILLICMHLIYS